MRGAYWVPVLLLATGCLAQSPEVQARRMDAQWEALEETHRETLDARYRPGTHKREIAPPPGVHGEEVYVHLGEPVDRYLAFCIEKSNASSPTRVHTCVRYRINEVNAATETTAHYEDLLFFDRGNRLIRAYRRPSHLR